MDEEKDLDAIIAAGGRKGEIYAALRDLRDLRDRYADAIRAGFPSVAEMPRRVSGFNLDELLPEKGFNVARALCGTESTCATALQAVLLLTPALLQRTLVVVEYADIADAAEHTGEIVEKFRPIGLEALDDQLIEDQRRQGKNIADIQELPLQDGGAWLLVQLGADGWQSKEVAESLDLCLACKGCTNDCPVNVDIPTYKSEFLYHHYKSVRRWRPRYAYAFGFIDQASRLASRMPEAVNFATHTPGLARLAKLVAGIDRRRPLPRFAPMTLQQWFRERGGTTNPYGRPVVLFPDTFNNHFHTDVGVACVEAIEAAGWKVVMPETHVCCGRPLYDYGFLDMAERYLYNVLDVLRPHVRAGTPVVGMEPSCLAVFKDELTKLLPHDDDAARLAEHAHHFAEFFQTYGIRPPELPGGGKALLWGHCHHRATGGIDPEQKVLEQMGLETESLKGGCCGLAGSWGFENGKYGISMDCGEQALLPAVRDADDGTAIVANGFSCKTQIEHAKTGRRALHIAQLMQLAGESGGPIGGRPEKARRAGRPAPPLSRRAARVGAAVGAGAVTAAGIGLALRRPGTRRM
ncbi:heterodisulfide reductase-related iron-sulfur binding cluster [Actinomadura bangladeshensis]|uniref:heterodisulfide reductase-related iron-sulfur binding cluster n=1 Tax=Actinomadura bangladeshensis TaxID=453573 RepID=UPI001A9D43DF|nr:heterodisulfide reductase-related iron-sulfur binding cluster [Actinomadura bangladeshensis]